MFVLAHTVIIAGNKGKFKQVSILYGHQERNAVYLIIYEFCDAQPTQMLYWTEPLMSYLFFSTESFYDWNDRSPAS